MSRIILEVEHGKPGIEFSLVSDQGQFERIATFQGSMAQASLQAQALRRERGLGLDCEIEPTMSFRLRDYLGPDGRYPYARLEGDLEQALRQGFTVYLWSVPGFFMLSGHPMEDGKPWSNGHKYFATAKQALKA